MTLGDEKYLLLTTFKRSGDAVACPVWVVPVSDGRLGFWTADGSGKTKRMRATSRVAIQPCDAKGQTDERQRPDRGERRVGQVGRAV